MNSSDKKQLTADIRIKQIFLTVYNGSQSQVHKIFTLVTPNFISKLQYDQFSE